ncbi:hypothetical protein Scep_011067 [Stephania cephalantha]|uniref:Uncharacterized protein n=1 Tax=Stephania cephalantha TaxID=152367 RepID=A0AAP0PHV8_9MAGN
MGANTTPFSIRNYVLAVRDKDIYRNWPFHDEHLQFCMKLGISRVLPPFESHDLMRKNKSNGNYDSGSNHAKDVKTIFSSMDKPNIVGLDREEEHMMERHDHIEKISVMNGLQYSLSPIVLHLTTNEASNDMDKFVAASTACATKKMRYKRKKRKGKPKMRSMTDICAEARPSTLEELDGTGRSKWRFDSRNLKPYTDNQVAMEVEHIANEVNESMVTVDYHDQSCAATENFWKTKHPRDGVGISHKSVLDKRNLLMKNMQGFQGIYDFSSLIRRKNLAFGSQNSKKAEIQKREIASCRPRNFHI